MTEVLRMKENRNNWGKIQSSCLQQLISELNKRCYKFFILRNYKDLPEINPSKDIDIIIEPGTYKKVIAILKALYKTFGFEQLHVVKYERVHCCYGMDLKNNLSIHIDLIEGYSTKGFEIFTFAQLYQNTIVYKGFRVLNEPYDAVMLLYYKLFSAGFLKETYKEEIKSKYAKQPDAIQHIIKNTLNNAIAQKLITFLNTSNFKAIEAMSLSLKRSAKSVVFKKRPIETLWGVTKFLGEKFYRIIICPKRFRNFISVHGPDGSGKSTFINVLQEAIAYYYVDEVTKSNVYHFRPRILPNLGEIGAKTGNFDVDRAYHNPHRAKPAGYVSSFIRMCYYWLDYFIGVPLKLRKNVQFDRFTIFDRYIYDFLIDPRRSRIRLPYWLRQIFVKLVPQPRLVFILLTDAETIYSRKQELTLAEIQRQIKAYETLAASNKRFVILEASQSPEALVNEAMNIIIKKFTKPLA